MDISRSAVQAALAVIIVGGVVFIIATQREGQPPYEVLFSIVGIIVGYYFGHEAATKKGDGTDA